MDSSTVAAAIIAGGQARRLGGRDKSRLIVEGRPIIVRQVETLQLVAREVFIVASDRARFSDVPLPVTADLHPDTGVLGAIYTALAFSTCPLVITVACDLPFLHAGLLGRLVELARDRDGAWVATPRGVEPLLACYQRTAADRILAEIRGRRLRAGAIDRVLDLATVGPAELARFAPVERLLANVNTPDDYARIQYPPA